MLSYSMTLRVLSLVDIDRYLGISYPAMLSVIDLRMWATNRDWRGLYGMWWNKRVPYKIKRTLFRGAVYGSSLTGLTALLLHDRDHLRLLTLCVPNFRMHLETRDTLFDGLRLHPVANGQTKRLMADLQAMA